MPKGFEEIGNALETDAALRKTFFSRVRMFFFAGAGLAQPVWDKLDRVAEQECGERIRMLTGLGMTETAPFAICANAQEVKSGHIGLPAPGCELKVVADGPGPNAKTEVRATAARTSRPATGGERRRRPRASTPRASSIAATPPSRSTRRMPERGFAFDGRIAEDFKLSTGTLNLVGPLRAAIVAAGDPLVQDVAIAGINRSDIGVLFFPRLDACRAFTGLPLNAPAHIVLGDPRRCGRSSSAWWTRCICAAAAARRASPAPWCWPSSPSIDRRRDHRQGALPDPARGADLIGDSDVARMYLGRDRDVLLPRPH